MKRDVLWTTLTLVVAGCGGGMNSYGTSGGSASTTATPSSTTNGAPTATPTSSAPTNATAAGFVITIQNMGFTPLNLAAPAGATVTVVNLDGMAHSLTSEPSAGSYKRGAPSGLTPFDTGTFSSGQKTITVPANATAGTVIPYFCTVHTSTMTTPNGTITIDPSAKPASATATSVPAPITSVPGPTTSMPAPTPLPAPMPLPTPVPSMGGGGY